MATAEHHNEFDRGRKVGCEFAESTMEVASQQSLRLDLTPADVASALRAESGASGRRRRLGHGACTKSRRTLFTVR